MTAEPLTAQRVREEMEQAKVAYAFAMGQQGGVGDDPLGIESSLRVAMALPRVKRMSP